MLNQNIDWHSELVESDALAVVRSDNAIYNLPVFINAPTNECFVKPYGQFVPVSGLKGFQRYERIRTKQSLNSATQELVEA